MFPLWRDAWPYTQSVSFFRYKMKPRKILHMKNIINCPHFEQDWGILFLTFNYVELYRLKKKKSWSMFCPRYATISLVPDYERHKPKQTEYNSCGFCPCSASISLVLVSEGYKRKRDEINSCGVTQQYNKLLSNGPVLSIMVHKHFGAYLHGG